MPDLLLSLFAGWPAIVATVVLAILGLVRNNYRLLVGAADLFSIALAHRVHSVGKDQAGLHKVYPAIVLHLPLAKEAQRDAGLR